MRATLARPGFLPGARTSSHGCATARSPLTWSSTSKACPDLHELHLDGETLHIGSLVTFSDLINSEVIASRAPLLAEMAETVASTGIRNRATLVGNICSAVPSCDAGPVLLGYDTTVHLVGPEGSRTVGINDWFVGLRKTARTEDEIVSHLTIEVPDHGGVYVKLMRYAGEDLAQAAVGIVAYPGDEYRVAFGAVAPTPFRSARIEEALHGRPLEDELIAEVVAMVEDEISPITDIRATAAYRTRMTEVMLKRGLPAATRQAQRRGTGVRHTFDLSNRRRGRRWS